MYTTRACVRHEVIPSLLAIASYQKAAFWHHCGEVVLYRAIYAYITVFVAEYVAFLALPKFYIERNGYVKKVECGYDTLLRYL